MVVGEVHPRNQDPVHDTRVPCMRVLNIEWGMLSAVVLRFSMRFLIRGQETLRNFAGQVLLVTAKKKIAVDVIT